MRIPVRFVSLLFVTVCSLAQARNHVEIAGSSTVFPFTAAVIQRFTAVSDVPVVNRSTGTGGGMHAFCGGVGDEFPDFTGASRQIQERERQYCHDNGVRLITALPIGYDGIVVASSAGAPRIGLTRTDLYQALAKEVVKDGAIIPNPYRTWKEVNPALPDWEIVVLGPTSTSGTRDSFEQLALEPACDSLQAVRALEPARRDEVCTTIRRDGHFIELGEDDVEIVKQLRNQPRSFGIFGYSYLLQFKDIVQANPVDGILPTDETIETHRYPLARPLFLYVKDVRVQNTPGLSQFLQEYISDRAIGPEGYLTNIGLVPLNDTARLEVRCKLARLLKLETPACDTAETE
jgi:phosphate transport system substrate-binding protein